MMGAYICITGFQQPPESYIIVHDGSHIEWGKHVPLFDRTDIVMMGKASFSLEEAPPRPLRITYPSKMILTNVLTARLSQLEENTASLQQKVALLQEFPLGSHGEDMEESVSILSGEVRMLSQTVALQEERLKNLFQGHFDIPLDQLSHPELVKICAKIALLEEKFLSLQEGVSAAVGATTVASVGEDGGGLAALKDFVRSRVKKASFHKNEEELAKSIVLPHTACLEVDRDITLCGHGESITFSDTSEPQLRVKRGVTLTLKDITFKGVGSTSILLEAGARIVLHNKVRWELHADLHFSQGSLVVGGTETVAQICGIGGIRHIWLVDAQTRQKCRLDLGCNTLSLSHVVLHDAHMVHAKAHAQRNATLFGALALCSHATIELGGDLSTALVVYGSNNYLTCLQSGYRLNGPLMYAPFGDNQLTMHVMMHNHQKAMLTLGPKAIAVGSEEGTARLMCTNEQLQLRLEADNSLTMGASGTLDTGHLELKKNPILQIDPSARYTARSHIVAHSGDSIVFGSHVGPLMQTVLHKQLYQKYGGTKEHTWHSAAVQDSMVYYHECGMKHAAGTIVLRGRHACAVDFGVDTQERLELILVDGARVEQGSVTTLKKDDVIRVRGKNNKITITQDFVWHGSIVCEDDAELIVEVKGGAHLLLETIREHACVLGNNAHLRFVGGGEIALSRTLYVDMCDTFEKPSLLSFSDDVLCRLTARAQLLVSGCGDVRVERGAHMEIGSGALVGIGQEKGDCLTFTVDTRASVFVGSYMKHSGAARGVLSLSHGMFAFMCLRKGSLKIGRNGAFECNVRRGDPARGVCRSMRFASGGTCELTEHGVMTLSDNRMIGAKQAPMVWQEQGGCLFGKGCIGIAGKGIAGVCQKKKINEEAFVLRGDARALMLSFVNLVKALNNTIYFVNSEGIKTVITSHNVIVTIGDDEEIVHDDPGTGIISGTNPRGSFIIKPNGQRIG